MLHIYNTLGLTATPPMQRAAARLDIREVALFKLTSVRLQMRGHSLDLETTADGCLRYLVGYHGWFRHYADLESVVNFADRIRADTAYVPIKAPSGLRTK